VKPHHLATGVALAFLAAAGVVAAGTAQTRTPIDRAFRDFWDAPSPEEAARRAVDVAASGVGFDDAFARLKAGRDYSKNVATGVVAGRHRLADQEFFYTLEVPKDYDPSRRYRLRFQLHGGVTAREENRPIAAVIGSLAGDEQIYVLPTSWVDAPWWGEAQVRNLRGILHLVKREYNVDENRVTVSGVSDGGTAAYYVAMRDTTPYASFTPLIGSLMLLASRNLNLGDLFPNNLLNKPFFVVNGDLDPLYPTSAVAPIVRQLQNGGVAIDFRPQAGGGHDTNWWPAVRESFERFVREHPRNPLPDKITWQRGEADPFVRAHWLIVDRLDASRPSSSLPDVNVVPTPPSIQLGLRTAALRVTYVDPRATAARLGLRAQDVVERVDDRELRPGDDLDEALEKCAGGLPIRIGVVRGGTSIEVGGPCDGKSAFGPTMPLFPRRRPARRVDLVKAGNIVSATTDGVAEFTLLLSPDAFDFSQPVKVVTNGTVSFEGRVDKSVATLLKWAAIDQDRTMLFAAELRVPVK
jgi:acetyl esterase/lipase